MLQQDAAISRSRSCWFVLLRFPVLFLVSLVLFWELVGYLLISFSCSYERVWIRCCMSSRKARINDPPPFAPLWENKSVPTYDDWYRLAGSVDKLMKKPEAYPKLKAGIDGIRLRASN